MSAFVTIRNVLPRGHVGNYSGPQKVDHSGHLHLLELFPFSPRESRPDGPRQGSGNRVTDGDAPHRRTRSRTSAPTLALVRVHSLYCIYLRISRSSTVAPRTRCPTHAADRVGSPRSRPPPSGWCNPAP